MVKAMVEAVAEAIAEAIAQAEIEYKVVSEIELLPTVIVILNLITQT